jgi:hypothetical protein
MRDGRLEIEAKKLLLIFAVAFIILFPIVTIWMQYRSDQKPSTT